MIGGGVEARRGMNGRVQSPVGYENERSRGANERPERKWEGYQERSRVVGAGECDTYATPEHPILCAAMSALHLAPRC